MLIWDEMKLFFSPLRQMTQKSILQTVPEAENERPEVPPRMNNTRFWWSSTTSSDDNNFCTINVWIIFISDLYMRNEAFKMLTLYDVSQMSWDYLDVMT